MSTVPLPEKKSAAGPVAWAQRSQIGGDFIFRNLTAFFALSILILLGVILVELSLNARLPMARFGWGFMGRSTWDPVREEFGALPFIYGTVASSILALFIAMPLSLGVAVFLAEQAPRRLGNLVALLVDTLAAIPSVVYGLWGIFVLSPVLRNHVEPWLASAFGFSRISGGSHIPISVRRTKRRLSWLIAVPARCLTSSWVFPDQQGLPFRRT